MKAARAARSAFFGFIHHDGAAADIFAVELVDRVRGLFLRAHLHESEAAAASRIAVHDHRGAENLTLLVEQCVEFLIGCGVSEAADVKFV